jgi:hypothetical protein
MVVCPRAKVGFLGHDTVLRNRDLGDAIKRRFITNPTIIADHYFPREGDTNSRSDQNVATDFGAEKPPNKASPRI